MGKYPILFKEVISQGLFSDGLSTVTGAMSTVTGFMETVWDVMTSNPYITVFLAVGFVYVGIRIFKAVKRAAAR